MKALLDKFSVPKIQQATLISKAKKGVAWDVYDPSERPVSIETDRIIGSMRYRIERYGDGSVAAQGIEVPRFVNNGEPTPMSIVGCSISNWSGYSVYQNCQVDNAWGTVMMGGYGISFSLVSGAADSFGNAGAGFQKCIWPTTCSTPSIVFYQAREGGGPAFVRFQGDVSATWGSWNAWVQLNVGGDRYWQTNS